MPTACLPVTVSLVYLFMTALYLNMVDSFSDTPYMWAPRVEMEFNGSMDVHNTN